MAFTFDDIALIDSATLSKFVWGVDDATSGASPALSSQDIASIQLLVNAASQQIIKHVDSNIKAANYVETWDGAGSDELVPRERPINSVASVKFAGNGDFASVSALPSNLVTFNNRSIILRYLTYPVGRGAVQVTYNAGYTAVPFDIQLATILQFQYLYKKLRKGDAMTGLKSIGKMGESQVKDDGIASYGLISEVVPVLEPYKRFEAPLSIMFARVS